MNRKQAVLLSVIIVFSSPHLTRAQVFSDIPITPTFESPPSVSGSAPLSTGELTPTPTSPTAGAANPNFLQDLFLGASADRPLHASTLQLFDILGKAQKGLQTYGNIQSIYEGISGKGTDSITAGVFGILAQYGLVDPQQATLSSRSTPILIGQGNPDLATATPEVIGSLGIEATEPFEWRVQALNENIIYKNAIQKTGDFIYSPESQAILALQDQVSVEARDATAAAVQGGMESVLLGTQVRDQGINASTTVGEYGTTAQSAESTQSVNKLQTQQNTEIANILAGNGFQLNSLNESMVRNTSALGNIVATQSILVDKQTVSQYQAAAQIRQQGQIFTTLNNNSEYEKRKDSYGYFAAADASNLLHFSGLVEPQSAQTAQGQP